MKMILYKTTFGKRVVGFSNSIEEFIELNNKRTHPYLYDVDKLSAYELYPDVFAPANIEGSSNFCDYLR